MPKENWLLTVLNEGLRHTTEANTSRYVHEVIHHCFGWPFDRIIPQASKRGFIDYKLEHENGNEIHVEVKPIGARLQEQHIVKYLSRRNNSFSAGILTNLIEWQLFAAGRPVKRLTGSSVSRLHRVEITKRNHINELGSLIGYRACFDPADFFQMFSQSDEVLKYMLSSDKSVIKAIRKRLMELNPNTRTPNHIAVKGHMRRLLNNRRLQQTDALWENHLRRASRSMLIADVIRRQVMKEFNPVAGQRRIQTSIRRIILES